jgi:hypothetical protein
VQVSWLVSSEQYYTSCSCVPLVVLQKSKPNNRKYICGECQAPNYPIGAPGRKRLISAQCCMSLYSVLSKSASFGLHILWWSSGRTGHRNNNNNRVKQFSENLNIPILHWLCRIFVTLDDYFLRCYSQYYYLMTYIISHKSIVII